jgi:hypothetical protein
MSNSVASSSLRDSASNLAFAYPNHISSSVTPSQTGGAPIRCKGKSQKKCSSKTCLWTSRGYCRKRGKMTCRGKTADACDKVKINIPGLVPPVVKRCQYIRGNVRSSCRRIRHYKKTAKKSRKSTKKSQK